MVNLTNHFKVFRGLKVPKQELEEKYKVGNTFHLSGFTSSTLYRETAKSFTFDEKSIKADDAEKNPVLIEIEFSGNH